MVLLRSYSLCASVKIQPKIATIEIDWWQESKCNLYVIHFQYENIIHSWKWHNENNATQAKRSTILSIINYLHTNELDISEIMKMPWNQSLNTDETMHEQEHGKTSPLALTLSLWLVLHWLVGFRWYSSNTWQNSNGLTCACKVEFCGKSDRYTALE